MPCERAGEGEEEEEVELICPPGLLGLSLPPLPAITPMTIRLWPTGKNQISESPHKNISLLSTNVDSQ